MALSLNNLQAPKGAANRKKKRVGRGNASGTGTTAGRGTKGQKSRAGASGLKLKGMKKRLLSIPKLGGFNSMYEKLAVVNAGDLEAAYSANQVVTPATLHKKGLVGSARFGVKILGDGALSKPLIIRSCKVSASAKQKIEAAGGKIE